MKSKIEELEKSERFRRRRIMLDHIQLFLEYDNKWLVRPNLYPNCI